MRRATAFLLTIAMLAVGAAAVDAKPRRKSPRLHAFRSCTNLLGYAQRNGLRVTAPGEVRQDAGAGERVAVVNRTSGKSLIGRVVDRDTVAVEF